MLCDMVQNKLKKEGNHHKTFLVSNAQAESVRVAADV